MSYGEPMATAELLQEGRLDGDEPREKLAHRVGAQGYVYRIADGHTMHTAMFGDPKGVLYIGMASPGRERVLELWRGTHSARRGLRLLAAASPERRTLHVHVRPSTDPALDEAAELHAFAKRHGHLPVLNARWEGFAARRVFECAADEAKERHPTQRVYDVNQRGFTALHLNNHGGPWRGSLVWVWPTAWRPKSSPPLDGHVVLLRPNVGDRLPKDEMGGEWLPEARVVGEPVAASALENPESGTLRPLVDAIVRLIKAYPLVVDGMAPEAR